MFFTNKLFRVRLYHGSTDIYDKLEPTAPDLGNIIQKPGWSVFCWREYESAVCWSVFQKLLKLNKEQFKGKYKIPLLQPDRKAMYMTQEFYDAACKYVKSNKTVSYVYTIDSPIKYVSFGSNSSHKEYTTREQNIKPTQIDEIIITKRVIDELSDIITIDEYVEYKNSLKKPNFTHRGLFVSCLLVNDYWYNLLSDDGRVVKTIMRGIHDGELTAGDDIEDYLKTKGLKIKKLDPLTRILVTQK